MYPDTSGKWNHEEALAFCESQNRKLLELGTYREKWEKINPKDQEFWIRQKSGRSCFTGKSVELRTRAEVDADKYRKRSNCLETLTLAICEGESKFLLKKITEKENFQKKI